MKTGSIEFEASAGSGLNLMVLGLIAGATGLLQRAPFAVAVGLALIVAPALVYWLLKRGLRHVELSQLTASSVVEGESLKVEITLRNGGGRPLYFPRFTETFVPELGARKDLVFAERLEPGATSSRVYQGTILAPRGVYGFGPSVLRIADPLGWFEVRQHLACPGNLRVYPQLLRLGHDTRIGRAAERWFSEQIAEMAGESTETLGLRDWRTGDPRRRVHWKLSAKRDRLLVRETFAEGAGDIVLLLDTGREHLAESGRNSAFERSIRFAATFGTTLVRRGKRVTLVWGADQGGRAGPFTGPGEAAWLLDPLVELAADRTEELASLLPRLVDAMDRESLVVPILTGRSVGPERLVRRLGALGRSGFRLMPVVIDDEPLDPDDRQGGNRGVPGEIHRGLRAEGISALLVPHAFTAIRMREEPSS